MAVAQAVAAAGRWTPLFDPPPHKLNAQGSRRVLCPSCIVASRYWRVLVLSGCLFISEIGNRKTAASLCAVQAYGGHLAYATCWYTVVYCSSELGNDRMKFYIEGCTGAPRSTLPAYENYRKGAGRAGDLKSLVYLIEQSNNRNGSLPPPVRYVVCKNNPLCRQPSTRVVSSTASRRGDARLPPLHPPRPPAPGPLPRSSTRALVPRAHVRLVFHVSLRPWSGW